MTAAPLRCACLHGVGPCMASVSVGVSRWGPPVGGGARELASRFKYALCMAPDTRPSEGPDRYARHWKDLSPLSPLLKFEWGHGKPLFMRCPHCPQSKCQDPEAQHASGAGVPPMKVLPHPSATRVVSIAKSNCCVVLIRGLYCEGAPPSRYFPRLPGYGSF